MRADQIGEIKVTCRSEESPPLRYPPGGYYQPDTSYDN